MSVVRTELRPFAPEAGAMAHLANPTQAMFAAVAALSLPPKLSAAAVLLALPGRYAPLRGVWLSPALSRPLWTFPGKYGGRGGAR